MHTHFSFFAAIGSFFSVIVLGTLWRLIYAHLSTWESPTANAIAQAMAFQY